MGKKYEDEIREILKGFDDEPADRSRRPSRGAGGPAGPGAPTPIRGRGQSVPLASRFSPRSINPQQVMGFALILILFAFVMQGPWARGFPTIYVFAGYVSLVGTILLIAAFLALLLGGRRLGGAGAQEQRWRGQVIYLPNRQPFWVRWRHSLARLFRPRR
jgi:hypothetical protein